MCLNNGFMNKRLNPPSHYFIMDVLLVCWDTEKPGSVLCGACSPTSKKTAVINHQQAKQWKVFIVKCYTVRPKEWLFSGPGAVTQVLMVEPHGVVQGPVLTGNAKAT